MTALMVCLVTIATFFIRIPVPMTQGYVHLGDSMIFLSVLVLGKKNGATAAGLGSAMADLFGGYVHWLPWTLVIKFIMALIMGVFLENMEKKGKARTNGGVTVVQVIGMTLAGLWMVVGYYIASGIIYGNWVAPLLSVPWNIGQFAVGMAIALAISEALYRTPAKKYFEIK